MVTDINPDASLQTKRKQDENFKNCKENSNRSKKQVNRGESEGKTKKGLGFRMARARGLGKEGRVPGWRRARRWRRSRGRGGWRGIWKLLPPSDRDHRAEARFRAAGSGSRSLLPPFRGLKKLQKPQKHLSE